MSRKYVKWLVLSAIITAFALLPAVASAQGPSGDFVSGIACINLSDTSTSGTIDFYDAQGTKTTSLPNSAFSPDGPWLAFTKNIQGLTSGFLGSAVVSSGQQAACSVNTQTDGGIRRVGTSQGISADETGSELFATQVVNALGGFNSYVSVQNAESTTTEVTATYLDSSGSPVGNTQTVNIPANSSHVFYQDDAGLPANFIGSATFKATNGTSKLAGAVALYNTNTAQLLSFNTFTGGANTVYLPRLVKNLANLGYTSGWACQNIGPGSADLSMTISMRNSDTNQDVSATLTQNGVAVGQSWSGFLGSNNTGTAIDSINVGVGSAVVTSTGGQIACTVNEDNRTTFNGQGSTHAGVPAGNESTTMEFPQIVALGESSFRGGFQIANTTSTATTCTYTFSNGNTVNNVPLAANGSNSVFAPSVLTSDQTSFNGSVSVTCGQPIVGIYNLSIIGSAASGDPFSTNNGINITQ